MPTVELKHTGTKGSNFIFTADSVKGRVRVNRTAFKGSEAPATILVDAEFAEPKTKETREERKARLAALPKATPAQKAEKLRARLAKLDAKLAKDAAAAS